MRQLPAQENRKSSFDEQTCKEWFGDFSNRGSLFIRSDQCDKLVVTIPTAPKILDFSRVHVFIPLWSNLTWNRTECIFPHARLRSMSC